MQEKELVIVTGMSGAGKRLVIDTLGDIGFYSVDNLPPQMLNNFWNIIEKDQTFNKAAVMIDLRSQNFFENLTSIIKTMFKEKNKKYKLKLLYVDANDQTLVARYKETRRQHPLSNKNGTLYGIQQERNKLSEIKKIATEVISTDKTSALKLKQQIINDYADEEYKKDIFNIQVMSFGYKYGIPVDADIITDIRFLQNPYYINELRELNGLDDSVSEYIWDKEESTVFYNMELKRIKWLLPQYKKEGKSNITIAFGCTGGKHRSVALTHKLFNDLNKDNWNVNEYHRDINRRKDR